MFRLKTDWLSLQEETAVIPDRKLLQQISKSGSSSGSRKTDPYLDYFLGLAICNTVVVSMATAQRQRVSALSAATQWMGNRDGGTVRNGKMARECVLFPVCIYLAYCSSNRLKNLFSVSFIVQHQSLNVVSSHEAAVLQQNLHNLS